MARKSRKNMMPQAAVQEAVQQNEKELLRTAAYARLSVENGGHETEDSLHTQILQIHNYIRENPELTLTDTYADNGFTGTRFDRPEFERMLSPCYQHSKRNGCWFCPNASTSELSHMVNRHPDLFEKLIEWEHTDNLYHRRLTRTETPSEIKARLSGKSQPEFSISNQ